MIRLTKHAREQLKERGIYFDEIEEAIKRGSKELQGEKLLFHYKYFTVVARKCGHDFFIITVKPRW